MLDDDTPTLDTAETQPWQPTNLVLSTLAAQDEKVGAEVVQGLNNACRRPIRPMRAV